MNSGGKPAVKVITIDGKNYARDCYCCVPVLIEEIIVHVKEERGDEDRVCGQEELGRCTEAGN